MEYAKLKFIASRLTLHCDMKLESMSNNHLMLKSHLLGYRLIMDIEENVPYLNIDLAGQKMTNEIIEHVAGVLKLYNLFTIDNVKIY